MSENVVVVGGGIGGLNAALAFGRAGHRVTLLERDSLAAAPDAEAAFAAERRGAPQVHQTHGFLARLQVVLRDRFPDVLDDLLAAGGTTMPAADLGEREPGDEDLKVIIMRRTTLEWVMRNAVLAEENVEVRSGVAVAGLVPGEPHPSGIPTVTGVRFEDGTELAADIVIAANGRRGRVPEWLDDIGVDIPEQVVDSGLMYLSRWYRLTDGDHDIDPKLGGDLGFVKYLGVPGDGGTLSVTLAIRADDRDLRTALSDPDRFDLACRLLPGPDQFFTGEPMEPIGPVRPMTGLLNRLRTFVDADAQPLVLGFHALGDAHTCTNPLYGRGCALAAVQAVSLADAVAANPGDLVAHATAYHEMNVDEIEPWFHSAVDMDRMGADPTSSGAPADDAKRQMARSMRAVFVAAATEPVIGRGIARLMNLLTKPADLMSDPAFLAAVAGVVANPDDYPVPAMEGPSRAELLESLAA